MVCTERSPLPSQDFNPNHVEMADGIVSYSMQQLACDPSVILGHPAPGERHFFVDQLHQIKPGCKIIFSTTAENDPATVRKEMADLFQAQKQRDLFTIDSPPWMDWDAKVQRLGMNIKDFIDGQRRIKSLRVVAHTNPDTGLIVVTQPFDYTHRPRPLGAVLRVLGTETDLADEVKTDRFHTALRKHYGSDWQSDLTTYGRHLIDTVF